MALRCPICRAVIDEAAPRCAAGHAFAAQDGVLSLLAPEFERELTAFEAVLSASRRAAGCHRLEPADYARLPGGGADGLDQRLPGGRLEWRLRRYDLEIVTQRLDGRRGLRVLDVGAWNGWLSHDLARAGHAVTAVDYFADEADGLRAMKHYPTRWRAVQMDLRDLSLLDETFDLVIRNRCLPFFPALEAVIADLKARVAPGGQLLLTGLQFFVAPERKAGQVAEARRAFQAQHGRDLFLFPAKGYLDRGDERCLSAAAIALHDYPQLRAANLRARLQPERPRHRYGVWRA
jgi:SAM-dependent methyltransferase